MYRRMEERDNQSSDNKLEYKTYFVEIYKAGRCSGMKICFLFFVFLEKKCCKQKAMKRGACKVHCVASYIFWSSSLINLRTSHEQICISSS